MPSEDTVAQMEAQLVELQPIVKASGRDPHLVARYVALWARWCRAKGLV